MALVVVATSRALAANKETVTIDFAVKGELIAHKASAFARAISTTEPPQEMLSPLHPILFRQPALDSPAKYGALAIYPRATTLKANVLVLLSEGIKFDGKFPGEKNNWTQWDKNLDALVRKSVSSGQKVQWEIWSEPNLSASWKGSRDDYMVLWYRTVKHIRGIDPQAVIVGPSMGPFDAGWIGGYLKTCKDYDVLPDIISWHEKDPKGDIPAHVDQVLNDCWQDGHGERPIIIYQNVPEAQRYSPGFAAWTIIGQERSRAQVALRNKTGEHGQQMASLLSAKFEPRAPWWVYKEYSQMPGRLIKVSKSSTVDGMATWDEPRKHMHILAGRGRRYVPSTRAGWIGVAKHPTSSLTGSIDWVWDKFETTGIPDELRSLGKAVIPGSVIQFAKTSDGALNKPTTQPADALGEVEIKLTHIPSEKLHVIARRIAYSAEKASPGPQKTLEKDVNVVQKEAKFTLPKFEEADAYLITIDGL